MHEILSSIFIDYILSKKNKKFVDYIVNKKNIIKFVSLYVYVCVL
jgi:hypothetical protein